MNGYPVDRHSYSAIWPTRRMGTSAQPRVSSALLITNGDVGLCIRIRRGTRSHRHDMEWPGSRAVEWSGGVGCEFHDEVGVECHADPLQQGNGGYDPACFQS
jgi:hypothetical protein